MRIQVTYAQFLLVFAAISGAQTVTFYAVSDNVVAHIMIRDPKFGGTGIELIEGFPTVASFLLSVPGAIEVTAISN